MNIGLSIYGNLTGFSRFYANEEAKSILGETKFNFDVHNQITFLQNGEKLYAIFFSEKVVAISLITNILDSFRRPGNLVVTALVPRQYIVNRRNDKAKDSVYRLLNEVNDRFYEKNYVNGMILQNPVLLMTDYYTDILSNYFLESEPSQKRVNDRIDVNSLSKTSGYIAAPESSIPKYLSSIYRKSYQGYHHIFIASNAPANIDEPAEEDIKYSVSIKDRSMKVSGLVRLKDRIPSVRPEEGELPLDKADYTYEQVLNGVAGTAITAYIEKETIVLSFNLPKEQKTISFKFFDGGEEVPFQVIQPIIVDSDGKRSQLSSPSRRFIGKEIYGNKTIISGNNEYIIVNPTQDFSRTDSDTLSIFVHKGWTWTFSPVVIGGGKFYPVNVVLRNKNTQEYEDLSNVKRGETRRLTGKPEEWEMTVTSEFYDAFNGPAVGECRLSPKQKPATLKPKINTETKSQPKQDSKTSTSAGQNISAKEAQKLEDEKIKRHLTYAAYALGVLIVLGVGYFAVPMIIDAFRGDEIPDKIVVTKGSDNDRTNDKTITFNILDKTGDPVSDSNLHNLDMVIEYEGNVSVEDDENDKFTKHFKYESDDSNSYKMTAKVILKGDNIELGNYEFDIQYINENQQLKLNVLNSELTAYFGNPSINNEELKRLKNVCDKITNVSFQEAFKNKFNLNKKISDTGNDDSSEKNKPTNTVNKQFDSLYIVLKKERGENSLWIEDKKLIPDSNNPKEMARFNALLEVLKTVKQKGEVPEVTSGDLSGEQRDIVNKLREISKQKEQEGNKKSGDFKHDLKDCKSFYEFKLLIKQNKNNE